MSIEVNSFDVFDTIIARRCLNPTDIFDIIEKRFPYQNFKALRIKSESIRGQTLDDIYYEFKNLTSESDELIEKLKEFEIQTEIDNSYLIIPHYNEIKDGDILISDMYLNSEQIMRILKSHGFNKDVKIFSSSIGKYKHNGTMYNYIKSKYKIKKHTGDNIKSDIEQSARFNIPNALTTIHKLTDTENTFFKNGYTQFAFLLREFRHMNPYDIYSNEFELYDNQCRYNIPFLIFTCLKLNEIMNNEGRNNLLCSTRDGDLLKLLFTVLFPHHNCSNFYTSRVALRNYDQEYINYIKNSYNDSTSIIFDGHGAFKSGRKLYLDIFGYLPRVHLFSYGNYAPFFDKLSFMLNVTEKEFEFECLNMSPVGTFIKFENKKPVFFEPLHNIYKSKILTRTIKDFILFITPNLKLIYDLSPSLLNNIWKIMKSASFSPFLLYENENINLNLPFRNNQISDISKLIDKIVYINLSHRCDRREHIENQLITFPKEKIVRFNAIKDYRHGGLGCSKSHIAVLEMAIKENWENVLIVEDDMIWNNEANPEILIKLLKQDYDVIVLGGVFVTYDKSSYRLNECQTTTAYIVNKPYYEKLLTNFKEGASAFEENINSYPVYAIDQYWKSIQPIDKWYVVMPPLCTQVPDYSNILNTNVNYKNDFKEVDHKVRYDSSGRIISTIPKNISPEKRMIKKLFKLK